MQQSKKIYSAAQQCLKIKNNLKIKKWEKKWRQGVTTEPWIWVESAKKKESSGLLASRRVTTGWVVIVAAVARQAQTVTQQTHIRKHKWRTDATTTPLYIQDSTGCVQLLRPLLMAPPPFPRDENMGAAMSENCGEGGGAKIAWIRASVCFIAPACWLSDVQTPCVSC